MSQMRYFKKLRPETAVPVPGRASIKFQTIDNVVGWSATTDDAVVAAFADHMRNNRLGITEVAAPEFVSEFVEKKRAGKTSRPLSREEFAPSILSKLANQSAELRSASAAVAVGANAAPPAPVIADAAAAPPTAQTNPVVTPPLVKRKAVRKTVQPT